MSCVPEKYWRVRQWSGEAFLDGSFAKDPDVRNSHRYAGGVRTAGGPGYTVMEDGVWELSAGSYIWSRADRVLYGGSTFGPLLQRFKTHDVINEKNVHPSDSFLFYDSDWFSARKLERDLIDHFEPHCNLRRGCYCSWFPELWVPRARGRVLHSDPGTIFDML